MKKPKQFYVTNIRDKLILPDDAPFKKQYARFYIIDFVHKQNVAEIMKFTLGQLGPFLKGGFGLTPVRHTIKRLENLIRIEVQKYDQDDIN